jgi:hypothetical protein
MEGMGSLTVKTMGPIRMLGRCDHLRRTGHAGPDVCTLALARAKYELRRGVFLHVSCTALLVTEIQFVRFMVTFPK